MKTQLLLFATLTLSAAPALAAETAVARLIDHSGKDIGTATFSEGPGGIVIDFDLAGLPAGAHAVHIHSVGTCDDHGDGFTASAGHLNPGGRKHGLLNPDGPDAGDLPNLFAHADGTVRAEVFSMLASLSGQGGRAKILDDDGAALVIHAHRDDHHVQPIGGAGPRIACGVISAREGGTGTVLEKAH